jgi:hypothetical protein
MSNFPILDVFGPVIKKVRKDPKKLLIFRVVGGTVAIVYGVAQYRQQQAKQLKHGKGHKK